jgi:hypothetical protein
MAIAVILLLLLLAEEMFIVWVGVVGVGGRA